MRLCKLNNPDFGTHRNITLVADGWNLIGYSSDVNLSLADVKFNNGSDEFTWVNAVSNNKMQAYLAYYDSSSATASQRKFKYVATSGVDDTKLRDGNGYWIKSNEAGNLTLPGVGGSYSNETYAWSSLRFVNGSGSEKSIVGAGSAGWVENRLQYTDGGINVVWKETCIPPTEFDPPCDDNILSSWLGYFIKSNYDNLTLIRQN